MTAFCRQKLLIGDHSYVIEIQSVNRKGLDVVVYAPKHLFFIERVVRKKIQSGNFRGQVIVRVFLEEEGPLSISSDLIKQIHDKLINLAKIVGKEDQVSFQMVLDAIKNEGIESNSDDESLETFFAAGFEKVVPIWIEMKKVEGEALQKDIENRIKFIEPLVQKISERSCSASIRYREKIETRLKEAAREITSEDEDRILREVILYAEKMCISEEVVRLSSHISQMKDLVVNPSHEPKGRQIDFLVQEMFRETNTICSKIGDLETIQEGLLIKLEIEKIREQAQNIE